MVGSAVRGKRNQRGPGDHATGILSSAAGFMASLRIWVLVMGAFASAQGQSMTAGVNDRIEQHRKRDVTLRLKLQDGDELPLHTRVDIQLVQHEFLFGANFFAYGNHSGAAETTYRRRFSEVMNYATLPFYWKSYQPRPDQTDASRVRAAAQWCQARGIRTKGHPLVWNMEPPWLAQLPPLQQRALFWARPTRLVGEFAGLVDTWDVVNESTEGIKYAKQRSATALLDAYQTYGTTGVVQMVSARARRAHSSATLILNDYDTSAAYERQIQTALDAGAAIDVIGIQAHMHQGYWGVDQLWSVCERFAKFQLPLHFTEVTILSGAPMPRYAARLEYPPHRLGQHSQRRSKTSPRGQRALPRLVFSSSRRSDHVVGHVGSRCLAGRPRRLAAKRPGTETGLLCDS